MFEEEPLQMQDGHEPAYPGMQDQISYDSMWTSWLDNTFDVDLFMYPTDFGPSM